MRLFHRNRPTIHGVFEQDGGAKPLSPRPVRCTHAGNAGQHGAGRAIPRLASRPAVTQYTSGCPSPLSLRVHPCRTQPWSPTERVLARQHRVRLWQQDRSSLCCSRLPASSRGSTWRPSDHDRCIVCAAARRPRRCYCPYPPTAALQAPQPWPLAPAGIAVADWLSLGASFGVGCAGC